MRAIGDHIIVIPDEACTKSAGGLYVTGSDGDAPKTGIVACVGRDADEVCEGERVLFGKYATTAFTDETGQEMLVMRERDVYVVFD